MKIRSVVTLVGLPISFALPTYAQQNDLADPQTTQKVFAAVYKGFVEARNNHDAAAIAAHYTRDAVFVTPDGPIIGQEAIQKWYTDLYQFWRPKLWPGKAELHVIGTAGNEFWATGDWSETGQGKNGEPIPIKGYWCMIFVRESDDWKIRVASGNTTPDSVILINKSFAPQAAATPSPTAGPSTQ
jgi:ketosteroid isomerase-like protein